MNEIKHANQNDLPAKHKCDHEGYEYFRRDFLRSFDPRGEGGKAVVSVYEIPPGKSAYPYHYHLKNEEVFYILRGEGLLKTPDGEKNVAAGDFLFFPANAEGAHKLTTYLIQNGLCISISMWYTRLMWLSIQIPARSAFGARIPTVSIHWTPMWIITKMNKVSAK